MAEVRIEIVRWIDGAQPGWVECRLTDAHGAAHLFVEKVPVVTLEDLDAHSAYPRPATLDCAVAGERALPDGRRLLLIDTRVPHGVESTTGENRFEVPPEQVTGHGR